MRIHSILAILGVGLIGCGDGGKKPADAPDCIDADGDGYGEGTTCLGADCNDADEALRTEAECAAWCDTHETATGCPCNSLEPEICYDGAQETLGVGPCHSGVATCRSEGGELVWSGCEGQVVPEAENCDGEDDDCDGEVDDGTLSECGTCGECRTDCTGPEDCDPWSSGDPDGAIETATRELELPIALREQHVLWPYSANTGTVLRVDTETLEVQASFHSGPNGAGGILFGDAPAAAGVDHEGNVIVANRAPLFGVPSITGIAADPETCEDADGDGSVETSASWDDALPFAADDSWDDECIRFHVAYEPGSAPTAIVMHDEVGLDGEVTEMAWVGLAGRQKFVQLIAETGEATGIEAPTPGMSPESGIVDADGWIWSKSLMGLFFGTSVGRFDTADPDDSFEVVAFPGILPFAIAVDENGAPWVAAANGLYQWDIGAAVFNPLALVAADGSAALAQGIAADGEGSIWAGAGAAGVFRVDVEDMTAEAIATPGTDPMAMAVDFDGHAWAFGQTSGNATVVDLDDEDVDVVLDDCGGAPCLDTPQIAGDIAGVRSWSERHPRSTWTKVVEGCEQGQPDWRSLAVDARVPAGTTVAAAIRTADDVDTLATVDPIDLGEVADGGAALDVAAALQAADVVPGALARIEVSLSSEDGESTPTLERVELVWGCPDVFQ